MTFALSIIFFLEIQCSIDISNGGGTSFVLHKRKTRICLHSIIQLNSGSKDLQKRLYQLEPQAMVYKSSYDFL